ncbi:MAG: MFS transporter [Candidatus Thermoplasmatota archaeon]|nr:MFS transporter [Euryarchaeota archaeon]MBU4031268.1 MFS transporter [Candidatus Thermoplasmatota archaeon]MBU4071242.1 MFS transporter [Candidatus Thermoplasmatota archaeon]MBU4143513.1 MFS transporter [Candidatus Thermoplasmatota archaeon]MBU4591975.1 MFS transporter [Candidatus Thermoplasmatota archaeon]
MRKVLVHLIAIESLVTIAGTLAGVFSIVFLVNSGFSAPESSLFYLQGFAWAAALCLLAGKVGFRNPKHWMAVGILAQSAFYMSFIALDGLWLLVLAPAFFGMYIVCFWVPFNVLMLRQTSRDNRGEMIGYFFLVFPVIGLASPIIGGYLIDSVGYGVLFGCAFAALMCNAVLIIISKSTVSRPMKGKLTTKKMGNRLAAGLFFQGGQEGVWWTMVPLVSMIFVTSGQSLGYVFALINLFGGIASILVARVSDRRGYRYKYVRAAAIACVPIIFGIALAPDLTSYLVLAAAVYLVQPMIQILLFAMASDRMENQNTSCSITRELLLNSGRILGGALVALVLFTSGDIRLAYAISGVMVLGIAVTR